MKPLLVVGQGIVGSVLAWKLQQAQIPIRIFEGDFPASASRAAAGLISPITGKRWHLTHKVDYYLTQARSFYMQLGSFFHDCFWKDHQIIRLINPKDDPIINKRFKDKAYRPYLGEKRPAGHWGNDPRGSVEIKGGGVLAVSRILDRIGNYFKDQNIQMPGAFDFDQLQQTADGWLYEGQPIRGVVFCEGAKAMQNPYFQGLPFSPSQGEILTLQVPMPAHWMGHVFNDGNWLIPVDGFTCRVGATYTWDLHTQPTVAARAQLLDAFKRLMPSAYMPVVLDQKVGIRLAFLDTMPAIGEHPHYSGLYYFNGFGSKGTVFSPAMADCMIDCIQQKDQSTCSIPAEISLKRFYHLLKP